MHVESAVVYHGCEITGRRQLTVGSSQFTNLPIYFHMDGIDISLPRQSVVLDTKQSSFGDTLDSTSMTSNG